MSKSSLARAGKTALSLVLLALTAACGAEAPSGESEVAATRQSLRDSYDLRLHVILLLDDAAASNCTAARPCTTPADITNFVALANTCFAPANINFTFDPTYDWQTMVDQDLNDNLDSGNGGGNWARANEIAARYPGKIVIFLREVASSNFAYVPDIGQPFPPDAGPVSPWPNFIGFNGVQSVARNNEQNFSHELGHFLGLFHTHLTWGNSIGACPKAGNVACTAAEIDAEVEALHDSRGVPGALDGDLLADTAEDPGPIFWSNHGFNPATTPSVTVDGVTYAPDMQNVMSYWGGYNLSAGQIGMLQASLEHPSRALLTTPPCLPDFHNLPASQFQTCFDYWVNRGLWPVTLTVDPTASFISGSFQPGPSRLTRHLISATDYETLTQEQLALGVIPAHVNIVNPSGSLRFTATWVPANAQAESFWGMTPEAYETRWHARFDEGYLQSDLFIYNDGGLKFAGTWKKVPHDGYASYWGLTEGTLASRIAEFTPQGLKITHFIAYRDAGQLRYAAIWERTGGTWELTRDASGAAYQTTYDSMVAQGFRLHQLHTYDFDAFSAVWKRLTSAHDILGLEQGAGFTVITGSAALGSSSTASQGLASLSVSGGGFIEIQSPALSTADIRAESPLGAPTQVAFDLLIPESQPNPYWIGGSQMYIDVPSAGINHQYLGQVELTGLPRGSFTRLAFTLPSNIQTALQGTHSDVRLNIVLNVNAGTPPYLVDNLRFL